MNSFEFNSYGNDIVAYNKILFSEFPLALFNPDHLVSDDLLLDLGAKQIGVRGRGRVHAFRYNDRELMLRHYYRGGMISKCIHDSYLWQGLYKTRAMNELQMLSEMQGMNLPVPVPAAAHIHRVGYLYKADIVTQLIPHTFSLSTILIKNIIPIDVWEKIGSVIKQFHDANCNHADLNAHNILLNEGCEVFLIDFDKSKINARKGFWKRNNLARLERSLLKIKNSEANFYYSEINFKALLKGYHHN